MKNSICEIKQAMDDNWSGSSSDSSYALLKMTRLHELFKRNIEESVAQFELQHADFSVLATLRRSPKPYCLSPTDLYKSMFFSSGGLTKVLGRLVDANLIERIENAEDKRSKLVKLNIKGKALVETIMPILKQQDVMLLKGVSQEELVLLDSLLNKVLAAQGEY